jgi:hypothetical protein
MTACEGRTVAERWLPLIVIAQKSNMWLTDAPTWLIGSSPSVAPKYGHNPVEEYI